MLFAKRHILLIFSLGGMFFCHAQIDLESVSVGADVIVQGQQEEGGDPLFQAVWRGVPEARASFQLNRMVDQELEGKVMLDKLLESALGAYLDERIHFTKQGVNADLPANKLIMDMNAMIFSMLDHLGVGSDFDGFSDQTRKMLERLIKIDWSQARATVDGGGDQEKYLAIYYYVRTQREELERQMREDLLPLASMPLLRTSLEDLGRTVQVGSSCGTVFDEEKYMCALDMQLADTGKGGVDPELESWIQASLATFPDPTEEDVTAHSARIRKRDQWLKAELDRINARIDKLDQRKELWELRDRMDDLEDRLTGVELEMRDRDGTPGVRDNPLANLSDLTGLNITIRFSRNATQIDPEYRVLLNEVFEQLARSPAHRVLITGYSDRSGDPKVNLKLSEQRAQTVRNYFLQRGIAPERLLVNFYGDSRSTSKDPSQRRVEIEWLLESH